MLANRFFGRKRGLIFALVLVECGVLLVGGVVGVRVVREQMAGMIAEQVKADNARYADGLARVIESMGVQDTRYGSEDWGRMQNAVEQLEMPAGGFACILDANNQVVCHPDLKQNPGLLGVDLSKHLSRIDQPTEGNGETRTGQSYFLAEGTHYIASRPIQGTSHRLLVHQPTRGLVSMSEALTTPLMWTLGVVGASVVALTLLGTIGVARRYEHALESVNVGLEETVRQRTAAHVKARNAMIFGLAKLADSRDPDTGEHLERLCVFAVLIARQLRETGAYAEITDVWLGDLRLAAALHDIGKVGVADAALLKPGRLEPDERREIERHPLIAADTLLALREQLGQDPLIEQSVHVALYHHERWDGSGYPYGLEGDHIPLSARIVALADVYDALTSKRAYKDAMPHEVACRIINESSGTHFDPAVVDAFNRVHDAFPGQRERLAARQDLALSTLFTELVCDTLPADEVTPQSAS